MASERKPDPRTGAAQLEATVAIAKLTSENERLRTRLHELIGELGGCRRLAVEAIHAERRRIERDLHDGTQGRLVSLAISLGLLEANLPSEADSARSIAQDARQAAAAALDELREVTHGIYPTALAERGLAAALDDLVARALLPIHVELSIDAQPPALAQATAGWTIARVSSRARPMPAAENERGRPRDDDPSAWSTALLSGASQRLDRAAAHPTV